MAAKRVVPLTLTVVTLLTSPAMLALPTTARLLPAPAMVVPKLAVVTLLPVRVVAAPRVMAPVYVWLPLVVMLLPFRAMALAFSVRLAKAVALPTALCTTTLPVLPLAFKVRPRAPALSLLIALLAVMMALAPLARAVTVLLRVMLPLKVWLPVVLTLLPFKAMELALTVKLLRSAVLPRALPTTTLLVAPVALRVKARAVPSMLTVLVVVMTALLPLVSTVASDPKVMAPT